MDRYTFNKETALDGDLFLYQDGELLYMGNTIADPPKPTLIERIKNWFRK